MEIVILIGTGVIALFFWALLIVIFCNVKRVSVHHFSLCLWEKLTSCHRDACDLRLFGMVCDVPVFTAISPTTVPDCHSYYCALIIMDGWIFRSFFKTTLILE